MRLLTIDLVVHKALWAMLAAFDEVHPVRISSLLHLVVSTNGGRVVFRRCSIAVKARDDDFGRAAGSLVGPARC